MIVLCALVCVPMEVEQGVVVKMGDGRGCDDCLGYLHYIELRLKITTRVVVCVVLFMQNKANTQTRRHHSYINFIRVSHSLSRHVLICSDNVSMSPSENKITVRATHQISVHPYSFPSFLAG